MWNSPVFVLIFGIIVIALEVGVMIKRERGWGLQSARIVGITLVVIAVLLIVMSQAAEEKAAAAFGLLGTITGYLMGKSDTGDKG